MKISLRKFETKDLLIYEDWINEINAHQYLSRLYPRAFKGGDRKYSDLCVWYVIVVNDVDVGTIWLEKEKLQDTIVKLGVLIGKKEKLGIGIGQKVIPMVIEQACKKLDYKSVLLNVRKTNARAIACYQKCGFEIVKEGKRLNQYGEEIPFFQMRLSLKEKQGLNKSS